MKIKFVNSGVLHQQELLARAKQTEAAQVVRNYHQDLETRLGVPIEIKTLSPEAPVDARTEPYWDSNRIVEHHVISIKERCKEWLKPHHLAHGLVQIALESEAHAVGRRMTRCCWGQNFSKKLAETCSPRMPEDVQMLQRLFHLTGNVVADMIVETRLHRDFPVLRPAQVLSFHESSKGDLALRLPPDRITPKLADAVLAICAARCLFHDRLNQGTTAYFAHFANSNAGRLGTNICDEIQAEIEKLGPGDHYALMDRAGELAGFPGLTSWDPRPRYELTAPFVGKVMGID
jgi:hypothetical protein